MLYERPNATVDDDLADIFQDTIVLGGLVVFLCRGKDGPLKATCVAIGLFLAPVLRRIAYRADIVVWRQCRLAIFRWSHPFAPRSAPTPPTGQSNTTWHCQLTVASPSQQPTISLPFAAAATAAIQFLRGKQFFRALSAFGSPHQSRELRQSQEGNLPWGGGSTNNPMQDVMEGDPFPNDPYLSEDQDEVGAAVAAILDGDPFRHDESSIDRRNLWHFRHQ